MAKKSSSKAGRNVEEASRSFEKLNMSFLKDTANKTKEGMMNLSASTKEKISELLEKIKSLKVKSNEYYNSVINSAKELSKSILEAAPVKELSKVRNFSQNISIGKVALKYTAALLVTGLLVSVMINFRPVVVVSVKDKPIAVVSSKRDFETILTSLKKGWKNSYSRSIELSETPVFRFRLLPKKLISSPKEVASAIQANTNFLVQGYGVWVNGEVKAVLKDKSSAQSVLDMLKKQYSTGQKDEIVEFVENVQISSAYAAPDGILEVKGAMDTLTQKMDSTKDYTVKSGDTLWDIAERNKVAIEDLFELNPNVSDELKLGQVIKLSAPKAIVNVKTVQYAEVEESTPYETKFESDANKFRGEKKVLAEGINGKKKLKVQLIKQNGVEVAKAIVNENVISNPKPEVVAIGTKPVNDKGGSGAFRVPAFGSLSSRFGYRWGRMHEGVDIAGSIGTPIYAADGGTVIFSGIESGYGNLVKISHGNGFVTYYGHNSRNLVSVGQKVSKGQQIAAVGNTGRSTGPHVHFEVRKNGTPVDPLKYLK